jgi:hypothetical protein
MNRRKFIKAGALWLPTLFAIGKSKAQNLFAPSLTLATPPAGGASFAYTAATFDGSTQYFNRGATFTGLADSKTGLMSFWIKFDAATDGQFCPIIYGDGNNRIYKVSDFVVSEWLAAAGGAIAAKVRTNSTWTSANGWIHCLAAWDSSDINKCKFYVNGTDDTAASTPTNINCEYTTPGDWGVAATAGGAIPTKCCMSEVYFAPGQWLDITNSSNRAKFISGGEPVNLGSDGSTPTGTAPILYFHVYDGTNAGTGGNLTLHNGPLSSCTAP